MFEFFKRKKKEPEANENLVVSFAANDSILQGYKQKAQEQISYLIDFIKENGDGIEKYGEVLFNYGVKVRFEEGDEAEHMWVKVSEFKDGYFLGELNNDPNTMKLIKCGDKVNVLVKDVEDWILQDLLTKTKVGHFSNAYVKGNANRDSQ
ncbi:uncharacterized protein DUF2314 [Mucilaginibacter gracilis]|uniref:Uncharacterized protein DUF2314 n=1 Tax=Mucilaginibacter gracilis TaxID=423350 RepID=A0A495J4L0_9SPHI|nr:DUF2314 domain-containing protein [Mucilaginibacter gracilis]RKR83763.1 uncharacterized protein DUF2314 [Mucilaginibacter gracilis]